ncbi:MAG TPA: hypothetical protein VKX49_02485 [Bryobacteraceae bacterium]|nr:hypothetical protein [Bryobacteraceae bacterium]
MFGWWTNFSTEGYPRGQASATMMVADIGRPGDWSRSLQAPFMDKFSAPTVEGVDFPAMGLYQAWNDSATGTLSVGTYAASPEKRGAATSFRVTGLPSASAVRISVGGQAFTRFEVTGPNSIRIDSTIDNRQFRIETGFRGAGRRADHELKQQGGSLIASAGSAGTASPLPFGTQANRGVRNLFTTKSVGCSCCTG